MSGMPGRSECDSGKRSLQCHIVRDNTTLFLFQYLDVHFRELWSPFIKLCKESASEHSMYTYKASKCKRAIIRLHCATSKSSMWYMGNVPHGSAFERPHIYHRSVYDQ